MPPAEDTQTQGPPQIKFEHYYAVGRCLLAMAQNK